MPCPEAAIPGPLCSEAPRVPGLFKLKPQGLLICGRLLLYDASLGLVVHFMGRGTPGCTLKKHPKDKKQSVVRLELTLGCFGNVGI